MPDVASSARPPGMHDVARVAKVSHQTVSRVLNDHPHVRPDTKERVRQAIAELGYRRNAAARSLVTRRSGVIGVLTPRTELYGPTSSMIAVEVAAREAGYFVSLASVADTSAVAFERRCRPLQGPGRRGCRADRPGTGMAGRGADRRRNHAGRHDVRRFPRRSAISRHGGPGQPLRSPAGHGPPPRTRPPRHRLRRRAAHVTGGNRSPAGVARRRSGGPACPPSACSLATGVRRAATQPGSN